MAVLGGGPEKRLTEMTEPLPAERVSASGFTALSLMAEGWRKGLAALRPAIFWLILLAMSAGLYASALRAEAGSWLPLVGAGLVFAVGVELSRRMYQALIPGAAAKYVPLAHANLAVYLAFLFIGFFVIFFLMLLPGILMSEAGQYQLDKNSDPALVREAFGAMMRTPYGVVFLLACLGGAWILGWFATGLTLYGAATAALGKAHVFRTWGWAKGHRKTLALASLGTHVLPFGICFWLNDLLHKALPQTDAGFAMGAAAGVFVFSPFLLAGHGMAVAAWERLKPADPDLSAPKA